MSSVKSFSEVSGVSKTCSNRSELSTRQFLSDLDSFSTVNVFFYGHTAGSQTIPPPAVRPVVRKIPTSEDIPEHNPVTNDLSKYDWYTCIRASIDHKNTSDTSFKSPRHIEYILKLY